MPVFVELSIILLILMQIMKEKKYIFSIIILILSILIVPKAVFGQDDDDGLMMHQLSDSLYVVERPVVVNERISPWNFSTSVGSSFSYFPGYGAFSNMFMAPHVDFSATNRLSFHGGVIVSQNFPGFNSKGDESGNFQSFTNLSTFVAASYRLTNNFVVYGTGIKSIINPALTVPNANFAMDDFSIGAAYSFGNFTIGASFHSGNTNPYRASPFNPGRGMYNSPFYW